MSDNANRSKDMAVQDALSLPILEPQWRCDLHPRKGPRITVVVDGSPMARANVAQQKLALKQRDVEIQDVLLHIRVQAVNWMRLQVPGHDGDRGPIRVNRGRGY